jgi:hypothetical protein
MPSHQHSQPSPRRPASGFPVILDEADIMQQRVDADGLQRAEIKLLQIRRIRLQDDLILVIMLKTVRVSP